MRFGRLLQDHLLDRAEGRLGRLVLAERAPVGVPVVADRLVRRDELDQRPRDRDRVGHVREREQRVGLGGEVVERPEDVLGLLVQVHAPAQHGLADDERVVQVGQRPRQLLGGRAQLARQAGELGEERALVAERLDRGLHRRRRLLDRRLQRPRVAADRVEGVGHVHEQLRLHVRDRRDLRGGGAELLEELVQLGIRVGEVLHHRRRGG